MSDIVVYANPDGPPGEKFCAWIWLTSLADGRKAMFTAVLGETEAEAVGKLTKPQINKKGAVLPSLLDAELSRRNKRPDARRKTPEARLDQALDTLADILGKLTDEHS